MKRALAVAITVGLLLGCRENQAPLAPTDPAALATAEASPSGFIEEPRIGNYDPFVSDRTDRDAATAANLDQTFTFTGWVDFGPTEGNLQVYVEEFGSHASGIVPVMTFQPSSVTKTVNGRTVWTFSTGPFQPFRRVTDKVTGANPWPDGGTAKVGLFARRSSDGRVTFLTGRDRDGVKGVNPARALAFADRNATPVSQRKYSGGELYPMPGYLGRKPTGSPDETEEYYKTVYATETGRPGAHQEIWSKLHYLSSFKRHYFGTRLSACPNSTKLAVDASPAIYFNKGDLGIGREMRCSYNPCTGETACYVKNYGNALGKPFFSTDMGPSKRAIDAHVPFATVAMVSRGFIRPTDPNKVFFAVYSGDESSPGTTDALLTVAPLDNTPPAQQNRFIPGNCLVCHGAKASYGLGADGRTREVRDAHFLPFDLQHSLAYYSTSATDPLSRAMQEDKFRTLNRIVARTDLYELDNARALLNGFYGAGAGANVNIFPQQWSPAFQDNWVPPAWGTSSNTRQVYKKVVAPFCRTCHISHPDRSFGSSNDFAPSLVEPSVCTFRNQLIMPNAKITSEAFWRSDARAQLINRLDIPGCGLGP